MYHALIGSNQLDKDPMSPCSAGVLVGKWDFRRLAFHTGPTSA